MGLGMIANPVIWCCVRLLRIRIPLTNLPVRTFLSTLGLKYGVKIPFSLLGGSASGASSFSLTFFIVTVLPVAQYYQLASLGLKNSE